MGRLFRRWRRENPEVVGAIVLICLAAAGVAIFYSALLAIIGGSLG